MAETKSVPDGVDKYELEYVSTQPGRDDGLNDLENSEIANLEEGYKERFKTYIVLLVMGVVWGTCTLANVGPSSTYTYAVAELGGSSVESWIPNAALFPLIGLQPVWGSLSDRFGKKWFIVAGGVFGVVGNIVAGTASSAEIIIGGQALNGIGSSLFLLVIPVGMEIVSAKNRSFAQGLMGILNGSMAILGVMTAGAFSKMSISGWRWVYFFNAFFFGVPALMVAVLYKPPPTKLRRENTTTSEIKSIDYYGILLLLCGVVGIVTGLTWGGNAYPWKSVRVILFLILGALLLIAFGIYDTVGRKDGLVDHRFLESRNFLLILSVAFVDGMLLYGVNAFLPVETSAIFTHDPVKANVYLLPLNICLLAGIFAASYVLGVYKQYKVLLISSLLFISTFCGLLALVNPHRSAMMLVFTAFIGLGVGVTTVIPTVILSYAVPSHLLGTAETLMASVRALGGTIGITIFSSIYSNAMSSNLLSSIAQAATQSGLPQSSLADFIAAFASGNTSAISAITGVTPAIIAAATQADKVVSAQSFRFVWVANAAIGVVTTFLTLFLEPVDHMMTSHVEAPLEEGKLWQHVMHEHA